MSLYGALYAGVAGLTAQSNKLGVISDNISNVNTVGYKQGSSLFETLVTNAGGSVAYSPGGVLGGNRQMVDKQGLLQTTTSPTDIAISGSGFFVVNTSSQGDGQVLYTRAGSFTQDDAGNFRNSAGLFLRAWPLNRDGQLPGEPGNLNTTSSANLNSLETVNVQNLTGSAASTSAISVSANLKASQGQYAGASVVAGMNSLDPINGTNSANTIIYPSITDGIVRGDKFTISTTGSVTNAATYTYGGFTIGRSVTDNTVHVDSATLPTSGTTGAQAFTLTPGSSSVKMTLSAAQYGNMSDLHVGSVITISGNNTAFDGLSATALDGQFVVTALDTTTDPLNPTVTFSLPSSTTPPAATSLTGATYTATNGSPNMVITATPPTGLQVGDTVTLANIPAIAGTGWPTSGSFVVTAVTGSSYTVDMTANAGASGTGTGGVSATEFVSIGGTTGATVSTRPFVGNVLDAQNVTQAFLGTTGTSGFTPEALTFTINTAATGTVTFKYTSAAPNTANGEFNSMTNLAAAINNVNGLTARIVSGQLVVGAKDANASVTFGNGSVNGVSGPPVQAGIDWVSELGLANVSNPGSGIIRFSTLQNLADDINNTTGVQATVANPLGDSNITIGVKDPLGTISFKDGTATAPNTAGHLMLKALGITDNTSADPTVLSARGPAYDPTDGTKNMAGGHIPAQFSRPVTVYDGLGSPHNLNIAFIKTSDNQWAVEVYSQPAGDVTTANGQVAYGTVEFNGDGSLKTINGTIASAVNISWANGAAASTVTFDWGTAGQPFGTPGATIIGGTDGMSQFDSGYNVNFVKQNGAPVGQLTGVSIDSQGYIVASYNNGETQRLYKIPLAEFTDPNQLQSVSGNAFAQSSGSGEVNLRQSGGSGVGTISSGALETSNVELAEQLTDMIVAQRAYQANTKIISTADSLLDSLDQILR